MLEAFPKKSEEEAESLFDLLVRIFVYDLAERITAKELVKHSWFQMPG